MGSNGGKCFRPERYRLTDSVFKKLMNINRNGYLVQNMREFQRKLNAIHISNIDLGGNSNLLSVIVISYIELGGDSNSNSNILH